MVYPSSTSSSKRISGALVSVTEIGTNAERWGEETFFSGDKMVFLWAKHPAFFWLGVTFF
jgi:hypothetical protein